MGVRASGLVRVVVWQLIGLVAAPAAAGEAIGVKQGETTLGVSGKSPIDGAASGLGAPWRDAREPTDPFRTQPSHAQSEKRYWKRGGSWRNHAARPC